MTVKNAILFLWFILPLHLVSAQNSHEDDVDLNKIPPRIIRACCAFGYDLKLWGVPFVTIDQVISPDELGEHHYMGHKSEGVGTLYTRNGGFIDMGHVRDQIDWTRFLYELVLRSRGKEEVILPLPKEAGQKTLYLNIPSSFSKDDCILLAGKITYDLSLWHEISTWFGASTVPFIPEKFSSFTVEDMYSNLLGVHIGMKALGSEIPFNDSAKQIIASSLDSLNVVETAKETYDAYDAINSYWFANKKRIPRTKVTLKRDTDVLTLCRPWLVPSMTTSNNTPVILRVPVSNSKGDSLTDFYQLTIDLNRRFPVEDIFPNHKNSLINQDDFGTLLKRVTDDVRIMERELMD